MSNSQSRLQDYYTKIPGVSLVADDLRSSAGGLVIRGITAGGGNPTVGIVVDDVPYGASTSLGGGGFVPDIDPSELTRVEVLRGPQGTLYGASSMGGLLKYVTVDPSTDRLGGRIQGSVNSVANGDDLGYNLRAAVNVPLSETWAIRVSGFRRVDPGYIDDPGLNLNDVNKVDVNGGRLSSYWTPTDGLSVKLSALIQDSKRHGVSRVDLEPGLGDLEQNALRGTGEYDAKAQVYSATVNTKLGAGELTSVSGYSINKFSDVLDLTFVYGGATEFVFGIPSTASFEQNKTTKFSQELRYSIPLASRVDWLLGAFYTHENSQYVQAIRAMDAAIGTPTDDGVTDTFPSTLEEYAAFTDLTFHITDQFDLQLGGRESRNSQTYMESVIGPLVPVVIGPDSPILQPKSNTDESSFTYLVTPQLKFSRDLMVYARLASGYRPGGPNSLSSVFGAPIAFAPDKTNNFEVGIKGAFLNEALTYDASVYYIDWKHIQLTVYDPSKGASYFTNASRAKSQGVELSAEARPFSGLTLLTSLTFSDAKLTESFPEGSLSAGVSGDRLPYSSRFSGNASIEDEFPVAGNMNAFIGASLSYIGDRMGGFVTVFAPPERQVLPAYAQTDLRAGIRFDTWNANLFVNNVADRRAILSGGIGTIKTDAFTYIQPRTFGMSVSKSF
jgi:outer membrane receptor protein involved in Fe transport